MFSLTRGFSYKGWGVGGTYSSTEDEQHSFSKDEVVRGDDPGHNEDEEQHHGCVGDQFLARGPDDLAQLGNDLTDEQRKAREWTAFGRSSSIAGLLTLVNVCHRLAFHFLVAGLSTAQHSCQQGRRDLNPQPPVLETGALPIELQPSDGAAAIGLWAG